MTLGRHLSRATVCGRLAAAASVALLASCGGGSGAVRQRVLDESVLLVPNANAGWAGWCLLAGHSRGATCETGSVGGSVVTEVWTGDGPPPAAIGYGVFTSPVATVSVNGGTFIPTRAEPFMPDDLRVVAVELPGTRLLSLTHPLTFTPHRRDEREYTQPTTQGVRLGERLATRTLLRGGASLCGVAKSRAPALTLRGASILRSIVPERHLLGNAFLTCASAAYTFDRWPVLVSVLLNAAHPGAFPANLPAMRAVPGHSDTYTAFGSAGEMVARRTRGAWLTVSSGEGAEQRLAVLERLWAASV